MDDMNHVVILDGHKSHTYNVKFLMKMQAANVAVVCLPPHSSHFLQPLDNVPMATLKNGWQEELHWINRKKCGQAINKGEWFLVFNRAWRRISAAVLQKGFRDCGIWPFFPIAIKEEQYGPSDLLCPPPPPKPVTPPPKGPGPVTLPGASE